MKVSVMGYINKQDAISSSVEWLGKNSDGYWVTLNALTKDRIKFEQDLSRFATFLNDYCYGRKYARKEKRLKMVAGIQVGHFNDVLHSHIVMTYDTSDCETFRSYQEINAYIRKTWYYLIGATGSVFGNLVDVQQVGNLEGRVSYALRDLRADHQNGLTAIYL